MRKSLVEAEKNLFFYEEKLQILEQQMNREAKIEKILKYVKDQKLVKWIEELKM